MSTAVAIRQATSLPVVSGDLALALYEAESGTDLQRYGLPAAVIAEAKVALAAMVRQPARPSEIMTWLTTVVGGIANPPARADVQQRAAIAAAACSDLPAELWTAAALRAGLRRWKYMPSVAEIREVLLETASDWAARKRALATVALARVDDTGDGTERHGPPTSQERDAVSAIVQDHMAGVVAKLAAERQSRGKIRRRSNLPPSAPADSRGRK